MKKLSLATAENKSGILPSLVPPFSLLRGSVWPIQRSAPLDDACSRPVSEGGEIQFRSLDIVPDSQHVPEANVVEEENGSVFKLDRLKIVKEKLLLPAVFGCVDKDEVGFGKEGFVFGELCWLRDIVDVLLKSAVGEVGFGEDSFGILLPRDDIERG